MNILTLYVALLVLCVELLALEDSETKRPEKRKTVHQHHRLPKEVLVIGGGIAGLAAARTITKDRSNFTVNVFEAQKHRYGGRVWTDKLMNLKARGLEVELGAIALNVRAKNNPLLELAESFELETASLKDPQFIVPWEGKTYSGDELSRVKKGALQILERALNESKALTMEASVRDAVDGVLKKEATNDFSPEVEMVKCLPTYLMEDYSTKHYRPENRDAGFDTVLLDGMGELVDRLLSGSSEEPPIHLHLNKAVRQIKVDTDKKKVIVRTTDGLQTQADMVVVAVPSSVLASQGILFDPPLPREYELASQEVGSSAGNRVLVEFEHPFWPSEFGIFIRAVKTEAERGHLQAWINIHRLVKKPVLVGSLSGPSALGFEKLSDEEAQQAVLVALTDMFGEEVVSQGGKIVKLQRSNWMSDPLFGGTGSYPKVGSNPNLWDTLAEPLCPYIYFAGEHTDSESPGSVHGAYNSGVRAGTQILSRLCDIRKEEEEERLRKEEEEKKKEKENVGEDSDEERDGKKDEL